MNALAPAVSSAKYCFNKANFATYILEVSLATGKGIIPSCTADAPVSLKLASWAIIIIIVIPLVTVLIVFVVVCTIFYRKRK